MLKITLHHPAAAPRYAVCCDPATLVSTAAQIGVAALGTAGVLRQGAAEQDAAAFQERVLEQQAERDRALGEREATRIRRGGSRLGARQRALVAGSGASLSGSPLLALANTAAEAEFEALLAEAGGDTTALRRRQQAQLARLEGANKRSASFIRAGTSLLGSDAFGSLARRLS